MAKILKNQTNASIPINDTGITLPASPGTYTIPPQDYLLWAASSNIVTKIGSGEVVVNDGSVDLNISDGVDHIKGLFPSKVGISGYDAGNTLRQVNTKVRTDGLVGLATEGTVSLSAGTSQTWSKKLRYDDMNVSNGGLARGTSITAASGWRQVYSYTGSGSLVGWILNIETKDDWSVRLVVDGEELFGPNGMETTDLHSDSIYDADPSGKSIPEIDQNLGIFFGSHDRILWSGPLLIPVKYDSSVKLYIRRDPGMATKKFNAGLVIIQKDS